MKLNAPTSEAISLVIANRWKINSLRLKVEGTAENVAAKRANVYPRRAEVIPTRFTRPVTHRLDLDNEAVTGLD